MRVHERCMRRVEQGKERWRGTDGRKKAREKAFSPAGTRWNVATSMKIDDVARVFVLHRATSSAICICVRALVCTCGYVYVISYARQVFQDQDRQGRRDAGSVLLMAVARRLPVVLSSHRKIFTREIAWCEGDTSIWNVEQNWATDSVLLIAPSRVGAALSRLAIFRSLVDRRVFDTKEDRAKERRVEESGKVTDNGNQFSATSSASSSDLIPRVEQLKESRSWTTEAGVIHRCRNCTRKLKNLICGSIARLLWDARAKSRERFRNTFVEAALICPFLLRSTRWRRMPRDPWRY